MIVLTYIKLHQSAMRDIVLLVDHAIKQKNKKKQKERHLSTFTRFNKKFSSWMRGSLRGDAERCSVGTDSRAISLCTGLKGRGVTIS